MTWKVPETQHTARWSGSFVREVSGVPDKSFVGLDNADWTRFTVTGTYVYVDEAGGRPPLSIGGLGTVARTYTDNLAANVMEGITGCFTGFTALVQRDYVVLMAVNWLWASNNNISEYFGLWLYTGIYASNPPAAGSPTGIYAPNQILPRTWRRSRPTTPPYSNEYDVRTMTFILRDLPSGSYTVLATHSPWGTSEDRGILKAFISVL